MALKGQKLINLKAELDSDPLARTYSGMDDATAASSLNTADRNRNRSEMGGDELMQNVDEAEWATRTAEQKQEVWNVAHLGTFDPFGRSADLVISAFSGAGGVSLGALNTLRVETISRAEELGFGPVSEADVRNARSL